MSTSSTLVKMRFPIIATSVCMYMLALMDSNVGVQLEIQRSIFNLLLGKCQVIVSDGVTLGHCCCGVFQCTLPLVNNRHQFCHTHDWRHHICAVTECEGHVLADSKTCALPEHQEME